MIEFKNVSKRLGKFSLEDISFTLPQGYIMGLICPNGDGKTTMLHLLMGLYEPKEGTVLVAGKTYAEAQEEILNQIGVVLVDSLYDNSLTLLQNGREYGRFYKEYSEETLRGYLKRFKLDENCLYKKLSKGQRLKFQFAFALSHNARLLILD